MTTSPRRLVGGLLLCSPALAEFVSGNLPMVYLWLLVVYVPFYGAGAVLVREAGRRSRRPWPVMLTLGVAYGVFEEAVVSASLFNADYAGLRLLDIGWLPWLGMGAWWTLFVVLLHTVWSIAVPIVVIESFAGPLAGRPWLGRRGVGGAVVAFVCGSIAVAAASRTEDPFMPSAAQLAGAGLAVAVLIAIAWSLARRPGRLTPSVGGAPAPSPMRVALAAMALATGFYASAGDLGPAWLTVAFLVVLGSGTAVFVARWSRRDGWEQPHRLALATGAVVPHVVFAFAQRSLVEVPLWLDLLGDAVFAAVAIGVLVAAWRRGERAEAPITTG